MDYKLTDSISRTKDWCLKTPSTFGVSGSYANGGFRSDSDLDIVLILDIPSKSPQEEIVLPYEFQDESWPVFLSLLKTESVHVFGEWSKLYDRVRLEVYPLLVARRILNLEEFVVKRLRKGPISDKRILFSGTNGSVKERMIRPRRIPDISNKFYSEVDSIIWEGESLFVGMHLERLLLTVIVQDDYSVDRIRSKTWGKMSSLLTMQPAGNLPFGGRIEELFFASRNMSEMRREEIRQKLALLS